MPTVSRTCEGSSPDVVLEDRPAVGARRRVAETEIGQPHRIADDALEHLVQIETGSDRVVDLLQRFELCHLVGQLGTAGPPMPA